jgi:hypothetical protein
MIGEKWCRDKSKLRAVSGRKSGPLKRVASQRRGRLPGIALGSVVHLIMTPNTA